MQDLTQFCILLLNKMSVVTAPRLCSWRKNVLDQKILQHNKKKKDLKLFFCVFPAEVYIQTTMRGVTQKEFAFEEDYRGLK